MRVQLLVNDRMRPGNKQASLTKLWNEVKVFVIEEDLLVFLPPNGMYPKLFSLGLNSLARVCGCVLAQHVSRLKIFFSIQCALNIIPNHLQLTTPKTP